LIHYTAAMSTINWKLLRSLEDKAWSDMTSLLHITYMHLKGQNAY